MPVVKRRRQRVVKNKFDVDAVEPVVAPPPVVPKADEGKGDHIVVVVLKNGAGSFAVPLHSRAAAETVLQTLRSSPRISNYHLYSEIFKA